MRINLDMLKTRHREWRLFELCLETGQRRVVDNTNALIAARARYCAAAQARRFMLVAYWFDVPRQLALARNASRPEGRRVPVPGLLRTAKLFQPPTAAEGFTKVYRVQWINEQTVVTEAPLSAPPPG